MIVKVRKDIKVALYRDGRITETIVTLNSSNNCTYTIENLDEYENSFGGRKYVYTVKELDDENTPIENGGMYESEGKWYRSNIDYDGNFIITNTHYDKKHRVVYAYDGTVPENAPNLPEEKTFSLKDTVTIEENPTMADYEFSGWRIKTPSDLEKNTDGKTITMPYSDVVLVGSWSRKGDIEYTVEKLYESSPGVYDDIEKSTRTGYSGDTVYANDDDKNTDRDGYRFDENNPNNALTGTVNPDGSLVLKVYFKKSIPRIDIGVSKIWLNEDNNLSKPSDISGYYVVAELWRRDTSIDDSEGEKVSEKILTSDGEKRWIAVFENMDTAKDAFTNEGYEYFVREGRVDEEGKIVFGDKVYTSNVTGNAEDGFIITNTKKKTTSDASTNTEEKTTSDVSTNTEEKTTSDVSTNTEEKTTSDMSTNTEEKTTGKSNIPNTGNRSLIVEFLSCILLLSAFVFLSRKEDIK